MTVFLDGPAQNDGKWIVGSKPLRRAPFQSLLLKRAPHYLRAVQNAAGEWDALDQLHDVPADDEKIVAYVMVNGPSSIHICARGKNARSGWFQGGWYRVCPDQPTEQQMRSTDLWRAWCSEKVGRRLNDDGTAQGAAQS